MSDPTLLTTRANGRRWLLVLVLVLFAISAIGYFPFSERIATSRIGTSFFVWGQLIYSLAVLVAVLAIPVLVVRLFQQRKRHESLLLLMLSAFFVICCIIGITLGRKARMEGMKSFAQRSQPLIQAIREYERDHSALPKSLEDLVPGYLPAVPSTGMMAYPEFRYHVGVEAQARYANNPWALSVFTPGGGINFDMILYFPNQNYPDRGYGGWLEPVGDWAYVHE